MVKSNMEKLSPRHRANLAIYRAIRVLSAQVKQISTADISHVSTYSQPTVIRAIQELEQTGFIAVNREIGKRSHYTILREMDNPTQ